MDNKKRIVNLEYFREMLHICPRLPGQTFNELPFEEEILAFLRFLRHGGEIRKLTDGMYHKKNVDFAYLLWEDVYQVEHKDAKKSNEMYYPRDDQMFTTIKLVSRHQNTQHFGVMLPVELTNEDIRNYEAYKEYYAVASGAAPIKTKASVRKTKSSSDTTITPPTAAGTRLSTSAKGKQPAKASKAKGLTVLSEVAMTEVEQMKLAMKRSLQQTHISHASGSGAYEGTGIIPGDVDDQDDDDQDDNYDDQDIDNDGDDFIHPKVSIHEEEAKDKESFDPIVQTLENSDDEGNDDASLGLNVGGEEGQDADDDDEELYRDVNINLEGRDVQMTDVHTTQEYEDTHVTLTSVNPDGIDSLFETTPRVDVQASTTVAPLTLTAPTLTPPTIPTISQVPQAPTPPTTASSTILRDLPNLGSLFGFNHRLKTLESNFSEFVQTNQFAGAISSIPRIVERYMDQWINKVVKTSYVVAANLSKLELKKILIEKMESNKQRVQEKKEGKEPESTSTLKEKASKTIGKSTEGSKSHQKTASESAPAEEPIQTTQDLEEPSH
nr:hypothetical protein [Tanacetum cinerariifolium]